LKNPLEWFQKHPKIEKLNWPAKQPIFNLHPIENICDLMVNDFAAENASKYFFPVSNTYKYLPFY
jgi:hypothetical protein